MNLDSQYGVCFRACLSHIVSILQSTEKRHRLHVVIEDNQRSGDCKRIFFQAQKQLEARGIDLLGTITPATKQRCPPLMIADFLAHTIFMVEERIKVGLPSYAGMTAEQPRKGHAGLSMIELLPDALRDIKQEFEEGRRLLADAWRAARDARRASSSASREQPS